MTLFLECAPDQALAVAVGFPRREIIHSPSKGRVSKALSRNRNVIGMVDEDPGSAEPRTLSGFVEIANEHDLKLRIDRATGNRLVIICPSLEPWLIKTAKSAGVRLERFSLSEKPRELHAEIIQRIPNLERLLEELLNGQSPRLLRLKKLLLD